MSRAAQTTLALPETAVRNPSRCGKELHRLDPEADEIPNLLPRYIFELADAAGMGLYHGYFEAPFDGRVSAMERSVRLTRSMNEKVISSGGVLDRLSIHLADVDGTEGEYKWDNEGVRGHHHVLRHGSASARQMCSHHRIGGQIKSYLPEHPEHFEPGDPLYHPKIGTKYVAGRTRGSSMSWANPLTTPGQDVKYVSSMARRTRESGFDSRGKRSATTLSSTPT